MSQTTNEERTLKIDDIRMLRPNIFFEKKSNMSVVLQQSEMFSIDGCKISFFTPNNVSLFVSIAHKELAHAQKLYQSLIGSPLVKKRKKLDLKGRNLTRLYNYLEHIQSSVIAIYTAVESLSNIAIPNDYRLERKNAKGVTEIWDKQAIERWYKTSEKVGDILPAVLEIESPKKLRLWSTFKELEEIRNNIIHQKTADKKKQDVDAGYLLRLLQPTIFEVVDSGFALISYFCNKDTSHAYFPLGFGSAEVKPTEIENWAETFEKIED